MNSQSLRLPDFLILGAMRCGSTTLANLLATQPAVYLPKEKELHFFDQRNPQIKTVQQYSDYFYHTADWQVAGEATPDYFTSPGCAARIHSQLPECKLVVILRNPVFRAWSHYRFSVASGREIEPFDIALNLEAERLAHRIHEHDIFFSYQQRGRYIQHIQRFLSHYEKDQMHVVILENLVKNSKYNVAQLFKFLNIETEKSWQSAMRITNQASLINLKPDHQLKLSEKRAFKLNRNSADWLNSRRLKVIPQRMRDSVYRRVESILGHSVQPDSKTRKQLENYYKPFNHQLEEYLGHRLPW